MIPRVMWKSIGGQKLLWRNVRIHNGMAYKDTEGIKVQSTPNSTYTTRNEQESRTIKRHQKS